jgi:hypothetical protein
MRYSGTESTALNGEETALHSIMAISAVIFIAMTMISFAVLASPSLSPVPSIADWDGDGHKNSDDLFPRDAEEWADADGDSVGDNSDAFPQDENEWEDSDNDGVGDNSDLFDGGNGGVRISLDSFEFLGYEGTYYRERYYPNPWFQVKVDMNDDGVFDKTYSSEIFNYTRNLEGFFELTMDVAEDRDSITFTIFAYDVIIVSSNNVTEYEIIDYSPVEGLKSVIHTVSLPSSLSWLSSGPDDGDTPDCVLGYSIETVLFE